MLVIEKAITEYLHKEFKNVNALVEELDRDGYYVEYADQYIVKVLDVYEVELRPTHLALRKCRRCVVVVDVYKPEVE